MMSLQNCAEQAAEAMRLQRVVQECAKEVAEKQKLERLRDEFAMAALTGFISRKSGMFSFMESAKDSYEIADLMLKAREQSK